MSYAIYYSAHLHKGRIRKYFSNPRSYAVYVGIIPFERSSGTSIHGRKRVSHIANKELKQELNQAARSAIQ